MLMKKQKQVKENQIKLVYVGKRIENEAKCMKKLQTSRFPKSILFLTSFQTNKIKFQLKAKTQVTQMTKDVRLTINLYKSYNILVLIKRQTFVAAPSTLIFRFYLCD